MQQQLLVDFITSLDGYASAEGWPGFWGLEGPEYLAWLGEDSDPDARVLMGATTYRVMSGFADQAASPDSDELRSEEAESVDELTRASKIVFSSTLEAPLSWANAELVSGDAVEAVATVERGGGRGRRASG